MNIWAKLTPTQEAVAEPPRPPHVARTPKGQLKQGIKKSIEQMAWNNKNAIKQWRIALMGSRERWSWVGFGERGIALGGVGAQLAKW